jgi:type IV pilus assembly protein PilO
MAMSFKELPWYLQAMVYLLVLALIVAAGEFAPLSLNPIYQVRVDLESAQNEKNELETQVTHLRDYERRHAQFRTEMEALEKQLATLRAIVPEEKEVDEFIRILQAAAASSNVSIRRLTAKPLAPKDYYNEVPFEVEMDGPYFAVLDFFTRLGRIPRIINVGDLELKGVAEARSKKYPLRPGTTVTGTLTATTFFTQGAEGPAPGKQPGKQAAKQPAKR